nr:ribonuclease Oy-like [Helicoverpa armigera]
MDTKKLFFLLCLNFHQVYLSDIKATNETDNSFDILVLSQHWPITQCKLWTYVTHPGGKCVFPEKKNQWTLHGIWPMSLDYDKPMFCNDSWPLDRELMKSLEHELDQAWTNVYKEEEHYYFWNHEWTKHGTCSLVLEPFDSQLKYFKIGIEWNRKYPIGDMLEAAGIIPSDTKGFTPRELVAAVKAKTDKYPGVVCQKIHEVQYLDELHICFDKQLNVIDCSPAVNTYTCDVFEGIIYPATV